MNQRNHNLPGVLLGVLLACLCGVATRLPAEEGIVATLQTDQAVYTNQPASAWCPPCTTNDPPCMLPCYFMEEQTAVAHFAFAVSNQSDAPRTFEFSTGQQFDIQIIDESGAIVAAWSDDKVFPQMMTSFTLAPGETKTFTADMALKDRDGQQLNGSYEARGFLTVINPESRVEATTQIAVTLGS